MFVVALFHKSSLSASRDYYIGAVEKDWNYAPTGTNNVKGMPLDSDRRVFICTNYDSIRLYLVRQQHLNSQ